jgi:hypothetical protein
VEHCGVLSGVRRVMWQCHDPDTMTALKWSSELCKPWNRRSNQSALPKRFSYTLQISRALIGGNRQRVASRAALG